MKIPDMFATVNIKIVDPAIARCSINGCKNNAEARNEGYIPVLGAIAVIHVCDTCFTRIIKPALTHGTMIQPEPTTTTTK